MSKKKEKEKEVLKEDQCTECFKKGQKVTMTRRGPDLACPKCNSWKPKEAETKEEKVARLEKELADAKK